MEHSLHLSQLSVTGFAPLLFVSLSITFISFYLIELQYYPLYYISVHEKSSSEVRSGMSPLIFSSLWNITLFCQQYHLTILSQGTGGALWHTLSVFYKWWAADRMQLSQVLQSRSGRVALWSLGLLPLCCGSLQTEVPLVLYKGLPTHLLRWNL